MERDLFYILFSLLGFFYIYIGYRASQAVHTIDDYFLAGRKLGIFSLAIALIATQLGGGVILGTSKEAFHVGIYGMLYVISISLGFIILASGLAARLRSFNVNTTAEIFEKYYKSVLLRKIASFFSIISLSGLLIAQVVASRNLMISLNVYHELLFFIFWFFIICYTMLGGLRAIVNNDIFQLTFIIFVFCGIFIFEFFQNPSLLVNTLFNSHQQFSLPETITLGRFFSIICIPALYSLIEQDIAQSFFAARTPRVALVGAFLAGIFMLLFAFIPVYFGMKAHLFGINLPEGANPLISLFDQTYQPFTVTLITYGVFAAIISTADALLCAISSHIVQDFEIVHKENKKKSLLLSKFTMLLVGIISLVLGRYFKNIIDVIVGSYAIPVSTLFVSLLVVYLNFKASKMGAYCSITAGFCAFIFFKLAPGSQIFSPEAAALAISFIGYYSGYLFDKYFIKK